MQRFEALAVKGIDPGAMSAVTPSGGKAVGVTVVPGAFDDDDGPLDLEQVARDQLRAYMGRRFTGHDLARLIEAVLVAQGYVTFRSPPGPDFGIDVLAGAGPLGLDQPKTCVQVKSGAATDVKVVNELQGAMAHIGASQGLLVAWGGLTKPATTLAKSQFFKLRVWDADRVIEEVTSCYERLSPEIQAELPLKRVWTVVPQQAAAGVGAE